MTDEVKTATDAANRYFAAVDAAAIADPLPNETIESLLDGLDKLVTHAMADEFKPKGWDRVKALRAKLNELSTAELQIERLKRTKRQAQMYELLSADRFAGVGPTRGLLALSLIRNALALFASTANDLHTGTEEGRVRGARYMQDIVNAVVDVELHPDRLATSPDRPDYGVGLTSVALMLFAERSGISLHDAELASVNKLHAEISSSKSGRNSRLRPTHLAGHWPVPI